jgi:hypothetical protein
MFKTAEGLNPKRHAELRFEPNVGYRFAAELMVVPLVSSEAKIVARDYVIVFDKARPVPYALLGVEQGRNAHVNAKGQWLGRYRPALIRAYPFAVVPTPGQADHAEGEKNYTVVLDPEAPQFQEPGGQRLFETDGSPTPLVEKVKQVLMSLQRDAILTEQLVRQLEELELLVDRHIQVKRHGTALTGFRVIDARKLGQLQPEQLAALQASGALLLAYSQIVSLENLRDGVLTVDPARAAATTIPDWESLFGGDETLDFSRLN